ncbi:MAG: YceI family protein [Alphaproteobacteria bacterium]|nr:YceI family protein [Alphaproteobacteria bacterium]
MVLLLLFACADDALLGGPIPQPSLESTTPRETEGVETFTFTDETALFYVKLIAPEDSKAHDHVLRASGIEGSARYDSSDPAVFSVEVSFSALDLLVDEPELRALASLSDDVSEGNRRTIQKHARGEDQLDVAQFTELRFAASGFTGAPEAAVVSGEMTIKGVTLPLDVPLSLSVAEEGLFASGEVSLTGSDFGIAPYTNGPYFNDDSFTLIIDAKGL